MAKSGSGHVRQLRVHSIFPSFQGEGLYLGAYQLFLRLRGCNLDCRYCDTREARMEMGGFSLVDGSGEVRYGENPLPAERTVDLVLGLWEPCMHSLALTGGEPLLQADSLKTFLSGIKKAGIPVYLETNGTLPGALLGLLDFLDYISMDIKLPSAVGDKNLMPFHLHFLSMVRDKKVFLKMVLEESTPLNEVEEACKRLGMDFPEIPLVLQPASPSKGGKFPSFHHLLSAFRVASRHLRQVLVIPQVHRLMGWR